MWIWKVSFNKAKAREKLLTPSPQINKAPNRKCQGLNNWSKSEVTRKQSKWQRLLFNDHKIYIKLQDWKGARITSLYTVIRITMILFYIIKYSYNISIMIRLPTTWRSCKGYGIKQVLKGPSLPFHYACVSVPQPPICLHRKKKRKRKLSPEIRIDSKPRKGWNKICGCFVFLFYHISKVGIL